DVLKNSDPAAVERAVQPIAEAGMRLWERTPPGRRDEMIHQAMNVGRTYGAPSAESTPVRSAATRRLLSVAASLARRTKTTIVVDPAVAAVPVAADMESDSPIEHALDAL